MSSTTKSSLKLSIITIFSRISGLARDHYQAIFFGTGPVAFAWEIAILLPGVLRNLLVEGGIAQAFIPIYTSSLMHSKKEAQRTAGTVLVYVFILMTVITIITASASSIILPIMTKQSQEQAYFMIRLAWILLLFMLPASMTAILSGVSNAHNHFVMPALAPIILNIGVLVGFLSLETETEQKANAMSLAWFFVLTAIIQLCVIYFYVWRKGFKPSISWDIKNPAIRKIFYIAVPAVLSTAIFHINALVDISIASYFIPSDVGGVPGLRFAQRLINLPTGIIGVAISTAILPILVHCIERKDANKQNEVTESFRFVLFLTVPATLGLFFLGEDIIAILFAGGQWDSHSTQVTWEALRLYLLGIPLYSLNKVLIAIFFAFKDTKTPLRSMILSTFCNLVMNLIFVQYFQHSGIALSTSITAGIHFLQLIIYLNRKHMAIEFTAFKVFFIKGLILWFTIGFFLYLIDQYCTTLSIEIGSVFIHWVNEGEPVRYNALAKVIMGVGGGFILYMAMATLMKLKEIQTIKSFLKR